MAATNVHRFKLGIRRHVDETQSEIRSRTRAVALRAHRDLVLGTRVDTGRARGNWQVGEGKPPKGYDDDALDKTGQKTLTEGARTILESSGDETIWLHNGLPYIAVLEKLDHMLVGAVEAARTWLRSRR